MDSMEGLKYLPAFQAAEKPEGNAWLLAIENRRILMKNLGDRISIPDRDELKRILWGSIKEDAGKAVTEDIAEEYIGSYGEHGCYCTRINEGREWPEGFQLVELRELTALTGDPGLFILSGAAHHILHWKSMNQYCGRCGHKTVAKKDERAMACNNCGNVIYPRISPATITAILREDRLLLAHNRNFGQGLYSLIAGYVEPGESLEQCVEREIREEVGIKVKNIRYFSSQPWSFPDSLMVAFIAEYDSGEIEVDKIEIVDAGWYRADALPLIPNTDSVAGKIIRWFREEYGKKE
ncbi:MAG TPA: NAD(+) diphosphatase [Clostridiales bacterium]|nr:NAD(+) diphosphatase [Clostridiales bacterium]